MADTQTPEITDARKNENGVYILPKSASDVVLSPGSAAVDVIFKLFVESAAAANEMSTRLAAQNENRSDQTVLDLAANLTDESVKSLAQAYETQRQRFERAKKALIEAALPILDADKMSEDDKKTLTDNRKAEIDKFTNFRGSVQNMLQYIDPADVEYVTYVTDNLRVASVRGTSSTSTSSSGTGNYKVRLNGGKITLKNGESLKEYSTFPDVAKAISEIAQKAVDHNMVIQAWLDKEGVSAPGDIPPGAYEFNLLEGKLTVYVTKNAAKPKS